MNIDTTNTLNYAIENGMLDLTFIQEQVEMKKRKEIIERYPYKIWVAEDGYARTYVPDLEKPSGRRMIKRKKLKDVEDIVIDLVEKKGIHKDPYTLKSLFPEWIRFKEVHTNSTSNIKRITAEWQRYYAKQEVFINTPIKQFTKAQLDEWAHNMIKTHKMTKKAYYNMSMILRQELAYAVNNEYIDVNVFSGVKINTRLFAKEKKKEPETQVYLTNEAPRAINELMKMFQEDPTNTSSLMVLLAFETGLRIGEMVALKFSDITSDGCYIHIQRQEVRVYEMVDPNCFKMKFVGFEIVEYTKSDAGDRLVYLTETSRKLIQMSLNANKRYHYVADEDYIFLCRKGRRGQYSMSYRIIQMCKMIGIETKSSHKIRKTYISTLIDKNISIDEVRRQAGHTDERTTYSNYCFNRSTKQETNAQLEDALSYTFPKLNS